MFQSLTGGRVILTLVALAAFVLVIYYLRKTEPQHVRLHVALGLVGGGAIGNLIDRIVLRRGHRLLSSTGHYWPLNPWPAFNIADAALVVGVGLMAIDMCCRPSAAAARDRAGPQGAAEPALIGSACACCAARLRWPLLLGRRRAPPSAGPRPSCAAAAPARVLGGVLVLRYQTNSGIAFGICAVSLHPASSRCSSPTPRRSALALAGRLVATRLARRGPPAPAAARRARGAAGGAPGQPARSAWSAGASSTSSTWASRAAAGPPSTWPTSSSARASACARWGWRGGDCGTGRAPGPAGERLTCARSSSTSGHRHAAAGAAELSGLLHHADAQLRHRHVDDLAGGAPAGDGPRAGARSGPVAGGVGGDRARACCT